MDGDLEKVVRKALCHNYHCSDGEDKQYPECSLYHTLGCPIRGGEDEYLAQAIRDAGYEKVPYIMEMKILIHKEGIVQVESIKKGKKDLDTIEECTCFAILGNTITNYCLIHRFQNKS